MKICKFCDTDKSLIKAHIIPKGFFKNQLESSKKQLSQALMHNRDGKDPCFKTVRNNGYYDDGILCYNCDKKFGVYEQILIEFLKDFKSTGAISKYKYSEVKTAILGILWKAHTTTYRAFNAINLEQSYAEILYTILKDFLPNVSPISSEKFPVWIRQYKNELSVKNNNNDILQRGIHCGLKILDPLGIFYRFDFCGFQIIIGVEDGVCSKINSPIIANDKPNIVDVLYRLSDNAKGSDCINQTVEQAFGIDHFFV